MALAAQQQYQPQFNLQINQTTQIAPHKDENTVVVLNLDKFVTESMLHAKFSEVGEIKTIKLISNSKTGSSQGVAYVEYKNESHVKEAVRRFNLRRYFDNVETADLKFMLVFPKLSKQKLQELNENKLFIKVTPQNENAAVDVEQLSGYLSKFGDVHQLVLRPKKGKLLNYGTVVFKENQGKSKALEENQQNKQGPFQILFTNFNQNQQSFNIHVINHNDFCKVVPDAILSDETKKRELAAEITKQLKAYLDYKQYSYLSYSVSIDETHKRPFFFLSVKDKETVDKVINDFKEHGASCTQLNAKKDQDDMYKHIHLKNLKSVEVTPQEKDDYRARLQGDQQNVIKDEKALVDEIVTEKLQKNIEDDLRTLKFTDFSVQVKITELAKGFLPKADQNSIQATIFFKSIEDGKKFLTTYLNKEELKVVKQWFYQSNPYGNVNILLSTQSLDQYKKSKNKGITQLYQKQQKEQTQLQFQQIFEQSQMAGQFFNPDMQSAAPRYNNSRNFPSSNQGGINTQGGQQRPYNPQYQQNQRYNNYQNGQRRPINNAGGYQGGNGQRQGQPGGYQQQRQQNVGQRPFQGQFNSHPQTFQQQQQQQQQQQPQQQVGGGYIQNQSQRQPQQLNQQSRQATPQVLGVQQNVQANITQVMTIEQIRQQADEFVKKPQDQQKTILGQLIYPKVKQQLEQKNEDSKTLTPKITGMLIDFTVFELEDIIEMIENQDELTERIDEALELIKTQAN